MPDQGELQRYLQSVRLRLAQAESRQLAARQEKLKALKEKRALQDPMAFLQDKRLLLDYTQQKLISSTKEQLAVQRHRFGRLAASLDALSPLKVLGRGYAMTGQPLSAPKASFSSVFGEAMVQLAATDHRLCAITAAMADGTGLTDFAARFPQRFFDVGIAEGHAVSM